MFTLLWEEISELFRFFSTIKNEQVVYKQVGKEF